MSNRLAVTADIFCWKENTNFETIHVEPVKASMVYTLKMVVMLFIVSELSGTVTC